VRVSNRRTGKLLE